MRRTRLLLNLAFSHLHEWLPSRTSHDSFKKLCREAGISRIAFLRHGRTSPKPDGGVDFDRLLTDEGRDQAREAGSSFGKSLVPFYTQMLVSPAPRTIETAQLLLDSAAVPSSSCLLLPVQSLYDGTMQPKGSQIFQKIGYAPLTSYVESNDREDRETARQLLGGYSITVVDAMTSVMQKQASVGKTPVTANNQGTTLWMVGHAIYLPAAALGVASTLKCSEAGLERVLSCNTKEAEGYLVDVEKSEASILSRPSSSVQ